MSPADLVMVRHHLDNCDHESAAEEFARVLKLSREDEEVLKDILFEAVAAGILKQKNEPGTADVLLLEGEIP